MKYIIFSLITLILCVSSFFIYKSQLHAPVVDEVTEETYPKEVTSSFRDFLNTSHGMTCTYKNASENLTSITTSVQKDFLRSDYTISGIKDQVQSSAHVLIRDGTIYHWTDSQTSGFSLPLNMENSENPTHGSLPLNLDLPLTYTCTKLSEPRTQFDPPSGVSFVDLSILTTTTPQNTISSSQSCELCETVHDAEGKAQCRIHFKCI